MNVFKPAEYEQIVQINKYLEEEVDYLLSQGARESAVTLFNLKIGR